MQRSTLKNIFLALILASALPLAACSDDDNDTPTSPTQPGPPVVDVLPAPSPSPSPEPTPPAPAPPPAPPSDPIVTVTGSIANISRSGEGGLDVTFRVDDFTIVRANGSTPVILGSMTEQTDALLNGQSVSVEGRRTNGFLDATRVVITSQ